MSRSEEYEPGLLTIFRGFVTVLFVIHTLDVLIVLFHWAFGAPYEPHHISRSYLALGINFFTYGILLFSLSWTPVRNRLGKIFLPSGLFLATLAPILADKVSAYAIHRSLGMNEDVLLFTWESILALALLLPLILIAWQYRCTTVVIFCIATAAFDVSSMILIPGLRFPFLLNMVKMVMIRTLFFLVIGLIVNQLVSEQRKQRLVLASANRELAAYAVTQEKLAVSRERNRIAREFHDTLAHTLSSITVELEAVKTLLDSDLPQAERILERTQAAAREGLVETRRTLQSLKPVPLEDLGLSLAVQRLAERTAEMNNLVLDWRCTCPGEDLAPEVEKGIYRIAQEALTNVVRHAQAAHLGVSLEQSGKTICLEVSDDGVGYDTQAVQRGEHYGLHGMQERARLIGAQLTVSSGPQGGTRVVLSLEKGRG